jgi:hypothetical protein
VADVSAPTPLDDVAVSSLQAKWDGDGASFGIGARAPQGASPAVRVLQNLTTLSNPDDLRLLADGLVTGGTRATDAGGYTLTDGTIVAWDAADNRVTLSRRAFAGLMIKLLDEAAGRSGDDESADGLKELSASLRRLADESS